MLSKTTKSLSKIGPFASLLFLFTFLFSLLGMELFAYRAILDEDGELIYGTDTLIEYKKSRKVVRYPRLNFNSITEAVITVFILVNGEDWIWIAQVWIRAFGEGERIHEIIATTYFVIVMLVGHLTLFALFTGILLHNFKLQQVALEDDKRNPDSTYRNLKGFLTRLYQSFRGEEDVETKREEETDN